MEGGVNIALTVDCELALADHMHQLDAGQHRGGRPERFEVECARRREYAENLAS